MAEFSYSKRGQVCVYVCVYKNNHVSELNTTPYAPVLDVACIPAMARLCIHSNSCQMSTD